MGRPFFTILISLAAVSLYMVAYAAKRNFVRPHDSAFTESLWLIVLILPLVALAAWVLYRRRLLTSDGVIAVLAIFALSSLCFALTVPAVFDRSVSLYLLNSLDNRGESGMTEEEIREEFTDIYFDANYGIRKRLREQTDGGTVDYRDGRYYITDIGRRFMSVARLVSGVYNLDPLIVEKR